MIYDYRINAMQNKRSKKRTSSETKSSCNNNNTNINIAGDWHFRLSDKHYTRVTILKMVLLLRSNEHLLFMHLIYFSSLLLYSVQDLMLSTTNPLCQR